MAKLQIFQERKHSVFYVAFRVVIQGAEVTPFITDDGITVNYSDREGPNTCSFTLHNAFNAFIITKENLNGVWRGFNEYEVQPHYSEIPKRKIFDYKEFHNLRTSMLDENGDQIDSDNRTYNFTEGSVVFNKHDPIRIFLHNPAKEIVGANVGKEEWVPFFTGFLESHSRQSNYVDGSSKISIRGGCIKNQLRRMRVSFTPIVQFEESQLNEARYDTTQVEFFGDLVWGDEKTERNHPLADKPFKEIIQAFLLGDINEPINDQGQRNRVGFLEMGEEWRGDNPVSLNKWLYYRDDKGALKRENDRIPDQKMYQWYDLIQFGDLVSNREGVTLDGGFYGNKFYSNDDVSNIFDETTTYGTFSPWRARLHFLLPPEGNELNQIINETVKEVRQSREWRTRYEVIAEVVRLIDFQWITSPMGDLVFEYPMYDFSPDDYGSKWSNCFKVDKFVENDTLEPESGEIITGLIATAGVETFIGTPANNQTEIEGYFNKVFVKSDVLAGKYGVNVESWEAPIGKDAIRGVDDEFKPLQVLALIEFQKRLSLADNASVSFAFHPYLLPNRNLQYGDSQSIKKSKVKNNSNSKEASKSIEIMSKPNKLGWMSSVTYTIQLFKDITVDVELKYIRDYTFVTDKNGFEQISFRYLFGGASMPVSFKEGQFAKTVQEAISGREGVRVAYINNKKDKGTTDKQDEADLNKQIGVE